MDRHDYMETLAGQIRWKRAVPMVERELETHIEEQKADFIASGMTESEAEAAAVAEMGDPVEVGVDMDRIHRPKMNWPAIAAIAFLSILGLAIRCYLDIHVDTGDGAGFSVGSFAEGAAGLLAGLAVMAGVCFLDYTRIAYRARELMITYFVLLAAGIGISVPVNGARTFIVFHFLQVSVNVRMALLLFIPLYCGAVYRYRGEGYRGLLKGILWSAPMLAASLLYSLSAVNVLVPAALIVLSAAVLKGYFKVNVKKALFAIWGAFFSFLAGTVFFVLKFGADYQVMRIRVMLNPEGYGEENYQFYAVKKLLEGTRLVGKGVNFAEAADTVPESMDFVLAYTAAYFGVLAAVFLAGAIILLFLRLLSCTWRQANRLGMLMGIGCGAVLLTEIAWYVLINMGIIIPGSSYCPFITYGNSGAAVTYILLGILLSIYRYQNGALEMKPGKTALFGEKICRE